MKRKATAAAAYHRRRDAEQLEVYRRDIETFIADYRHRVLLTDGPARQTLFFFPGGMACQLWRSHKRFKASEPNAKLRYRRKWLDVLTLLGNALDLGMQQDADDLFRDQHEYIVVADGAVNLGGCTPHDGLIDWCNDNNVDLFVYNWDWRRRQTDCAEFFVKQFWPVFKQRVTDAGIPGAASNFSLLGHSFGGMIVKLILENNDAAVARKLKFAITAATPFYGYGAQAHRWFEGEELLNGENHDTKSRLVQVICSMPGLYVLHYLDWDTYQRDRAQLEADAYPLKKYPSADLTTQQPFDPWQPQTAADGRVRYPIENMHFMLSELERAHRVYRTIAKRNDDPRFFNIRGVRLQRGGAREDTAGSVSCDWICSSFDPGRDDDKPIRDTSQVAGDNTQPAWTARLASATNPGRVRTVTSENLTHMFLMNQRGVLEQLASILHGSEAVATTMIRPREPTVFAGDDELKEFLGWIDDFRKRKHGKPPSDEEVERDMPQKVRQNMPGIAARVIEDLLKRPQKA
jgi:hypothetical protein